MKHFTIEKTVKDITLKDIKGMKHSQLLQYALEMKRADSNIKQNQLDHADHPVPVVKTKSIRPRVGECTVGAKRGKTSIYHYVWRIFNTNQWTAGFTDKRHKTMVGVYSNEQDTAFAIDAYLDEINDDKRPRNRDEFPEIMKLYLQQQNQQAQTTAGTKDTA